MRWWALVLVGLVGLVLIGAATLGDLDVAGSQVNADYERVVRIVQEGSSDACSGDTCVQGLMQPVTVMFSSVGSPVDVAVSVTLRYRTSPGDPAEVALLFREAGVERYQLARPSRSRAPLAPSHARTTASMSWSVRGLQGSTDYQFVLQALGKAGCCGQTFDVTTDHLVFVFEAAPAA